MNKLSVYQLYSFLYYMLQFVDELQISSILRMNNKCQE